MKKRLFENTVSLILVQAVNYLAPLMILPYLTRVLGTGGFGMVAISMSICVMVGIIIDYGFGMSGAYWIARNKGDLDKTTRYVSDVILAKFFIFILVTVILSAGVFLYATSFGTHHEILFFITINAAAQVITPTWVFQGLEKMKMITLFMVVTKLLYVLFIFLFIHNTGDEGLVIFFLALSNLIGASLGVYLMYKEGIKLQTTSFKRVLCVLKDSSPFFISKSATGIYTSASSLIVGWTGGISQAGIYSSAEKLYQAGQNVTSPITQALYPYMARTGDKRVFFKIICILSFPLIVTFLTLFYFSTNIITLFYGEAFISASELLRVFLIISIINFFSTNFGYPLYSVINRLDVVNRTTILGVSIYVLIMLFLLATKSISPINITFSILFVEVFIALSRVIIFIYIQKSRGLLDNEEGVIDK